MLLAVVDPQLEHALTRRRKSSIEHSPATAHLSALRFMLAPLNVRVREQMRVGNAAEELAAELDSDRYDMVVLGAVDRAGDAVALMGPTVEVVVSQNRTPYVLLVMHDRSGTAA